MGLGISAEAQGRGGRGGGRGGGPEFPTETQWAESAEAQRRVATAMKIAGSDLLPQARMFCTPTGPQRMALARQAAGLPPVDNYVIEPTRVFDNLYFIGMSSQNAWAITTSAGIILLDTLNSADEARDVIVPGMKKAGLDPAQIKYIVIGHGHPGQSDHTGGALYLQKTYGAKVVMNPVDRDLVLPTQRPDRPLATPDMDATHGQKLTLGDTTLTLVSIPGHTPGTIGLIVPVKQRGTPHSVMVLAATQMPTRDSLQQMERVFNDFAKPQKVEAVLNMHANGLQDDFAHLEAIRKNPAGRNPYLYGPERFSRWMDIMIECGRARLAALGTNAASAGPVSMLAAPAFAQEAVPEIPYESVPDFLKLPVEMNFGEVSAVAVNSRGHVFALSRSNISGPAYGAMAGQILEFDANGKYVREIAKGLYNWSFGHGLRIDRDDNIWQVDKGSSTVTKLSPQGRVLMVFGRKGEASSTGSLAPTRPAGAPPPAHVDGYFNQPTDVAWDAAGNTYISDGYVNSRVAKIDRNGDWVTSWGSAGTGPGQFNTPHSIAVDARGNVYVADRGNARIQVFDGDGTFLRQFKIDVPLPPGARLPIGNTPATPAVIGGNAPGSPYVLCITPGPTQYLYSADNWGRIFRMTLEGRVLGVLGKAGKQHGQFGQIHGMACPADNELYVAEILNWRVQKLRLRSARTQTN